MPDNPIWLELEVESDGNLTAGEIKSVLEKINKELAKPGSEASQAASKLDLKIDGVAIDEDQAFVATTVLIWVGVHIAGGAAAAAGAAAFNDVVRPRLDRVRDKAVGAIKNIRIKAGDADSREQH